MDFSRARILSDVTFSCERDIPNNMGMCKRFCRDSSKIQDGRHRSTLKLFPAYSHPHSSYTNCCRAAEVMVTESVPYLKKHKVYIDDLNMSSLNNYQTIKTDPGQSVAQHHKTLEFLSNFTEENPNYVDYELIGDNFDIKIDPTHTTLNRSRQTHHWFLLVGTKKRLLFPKLDDNGPQAEMENIENKTFFQTREEAASFKEDLNHHIALTLVMHVPILQDLKNCVPQYLPHEYMEHTRKKSDWHVIDLMDLNENTEMIEILDRIQDRFVPHILKDVPHALQKIVFGGDALTNERAYSAQLNMANDSSTGYERLHGIVHRPEGLHRMFNLVEVVLVASFLFQ